MIVSSARRQELQTQVREFYEAMGYEVTMPESVNGFCEAQTVVYRLQADRQPFERPILFFVRIHPEESDESEQDKLYAVFADVSPQSQDEQLHVVETAELSHA